MKKLLIILMLLSNAAYAEDVYQIDTNLFPVPKQVPITPPDDHHNGNPISPFAPEPQQIVIMGVPQQQPSMPVVNSYNEQTGKYRNYYGQ